jgi:hypothetical protein
MEKRAATVVGGILVCFAACQSGEGGNGKQPGERASWLTCVDLIDCASEPNASVCSDDGYCLDAAGNRLVSSSSANGTGGAAMPVRALDAGSGRGGTDGSLTVNGADAGLDSGGASCPDSTDEVAAQPSPVTIRIHNATAKDLYFGSPSMLFCPSLPAGFAVQVVGTALLPALANGAHTCAETRRGACSPPPPGCQGPSVLKLAPDASYSIEWRGTFFASNAIAESCRGRGDCARIETCFVEETRPAQSVMLTATAGSEPKCAGGACGTACTAISSDATGPCIVDKAQTIAGTLLTGSVAWAGESEVQIELK